MKRQTAMSLSLLFTLIMAGNAMAQDTASKQQIIKPAGTQASIQGPAQFFTGRSRIDPLFDQDENSNVSAAYVTFEPAARSHWHTHPKGQKLVVTQGVGYTQEWGKPIQVIKAGDVVECPAGIKHWHGAAPNTAMTHLAITAYDEQGKNVNWLEPVSDEQYRRLPE